VPTTSLDPALATDLAGLRLRSPVILGAGTAGVLDEADDVLPLEALGAITTKSLTAQPREGNQTWRMIPARAGMLNAIGLANPGIDAFCEHIAPRIPTLPVPIIASVAGFSIDDYVRVAARLDELGTLGAIELNVSCPNVHGGTDFAVDPRALAELIRAIRPVCSQSRLLVKLSPVVVGSPALHELARICIDPPGATENSGPNARPGADALTIANTIPAMAIDVRTRQPRLANRTGGLSGPAIHPVIVKLVHDVYRTVAKTTDTPIVALGGVLTWEDAAEFILAGATAVAVGTALFADTRAPLKITRGLHKWVRRQNAGSIAELIGAAELA